MCSKKKNSPVQYSNSQILDIRIHAPGGTFIFQKFSTFQLPEVINM